jgi:hypothetical protein
MNRKALSLTGLTLFFERDKFNSDIRASVAKRPKVRNLPTHPVFSITGSLLSLTGQG